MNKRTRIIIFVVLGVAAAGYLGFRRLNAAAQSGEAEIQTVQVERGTLTASISAAGTIAVPQSASLVWGTTGVVGLVPVAVGDIVKTGDVLMELDTTALDRSVIQAQADLIAAQQDLDDLLAGPSSLELAQAQLAVIEAQEALQDAQYTWRVQQEGFRANADTINAAEAKFLLARRGVDQAKADYDNLSGRPSDDPARALALTKLVSARQSRDSALRSLNWYTGHPTELQQANLDAEVALSEAELAEAEEQLASMLGVPDPTDIAAAEARVAAAQATLDLVRLVAPFDATVVEINVQVGDNVSNNTAALTLADLSHFDVQVDVSELDVNSIFVGQEAVLTLDAAAGETFIGRVAEVAFLGRVNQGVVTYPVTVIVDNPDPVLRPGMTAAVSIVTDRRQGVLIVPNRAVVVSGGQRFVTVLFEGEQIGVQIALGLSNEANSEILGGQLREGDVIVISLPTASQAGFFPGRGGFIGTGGGFGGGFGDDH
jgi:RND family efflux transporter MFP subunit